MSTSDTLPSPHAPRQVLRRCAEVGLPALAAGLLLGWALMRAMYALDACQATMEWDVLRDISIAQSIQDGHYPEDPILSGEVSWYNPLTGGILACCARLTGIPLQRLGVILGPFLNLLVPLGFYLLVSHLFGAPAALAGLCLVLFGKEHALPLWTCAYYPWLLAPAYSLGLLFITLLVFLKAVRRGTPLLHYLAGLLLGLTFLSHTAPALVGGGTMALFMIMTLWRDRRCAEAAKDSRRKLGLFLLLLTVAFFVSLPYTGPILWRYQFRMLNPWPSLYAAQYVELNALPDRLREAISPRNFIALIGLAALVKRRREPEAALVLCWSVVAAAFLVQFYGWQALRLNNIVLPSLVPGHHGAIHLAAVRTVLFSAGLAHGCERIGSLVSSPRCFPAIPRGAAIALCLCFAATATGAILYWNNPYPGRIDFSPPERRGFFELHERHLPMYGYIRDQLPPNAVVLCEDESLGLQVVMPAGRKLVCPMLLYSNPYVDRGPLLLAQERLLDALSRKDEDAFCEQAGVYPSLYVLWRNPLPDAPPFAAPIHDAGGLFLYKALCSSR